MEPVFIGGCERSGTTLLGSMLGAHSKCLCTPESQFKITVFRSMIMDRHKVDLLYALKMIKENWRFKIWDLKIDDPVYEKEIGFSYSNLLEWIVKKYGEYHGKINPVLWIDHTPSNIEYVFLLLELFSKAKIIHIIRDGRAVASSVMPLDWGPNTIITAAHWWVRKVSYGLAVEFALNEKKIISIKYEDLVKEPEKELKKICLFLNLDFEPEMVNASGFKVPDSTADQHRLVGRKPVPERISAWEQELTKRQCEIFESETAEFLLYLGYDLKYGIRSRSRTKIEMITLNLREAIKRYIVNKIRIRFRRRDIKRVPWSNRFKQC